MLTGDLCFINEYLGVQSKVFTQPLNISKHHVFKCVSFPFSLSVEAISKQGQGFKIDADYETSFKEMGRGRIFRTLCLKVLVKLYKLKLNTYVDEGNRS